MKTVVVWLSRPGLSAPDIFFTIDREGGISESFVIRTALVVPFIYTTTNVIADMSLMKKYAMQLIMCIETLLC